MTKDELQAICNKIPYFRFLDFTIETADPDSVSTTMPFADRHIGNPEAENYHGGIVASLLEATASLSVSDDWETQPPKPINLTVDYMRPARSGTLNAKATISRKGRRMASVATVAWQDNEDKPVAKGLFHFLLV